MEFNRDELMELLMDLDGLKGQISKIQDKLCKISLANFKSQPASCMHKENNTEIHEK